jgi:hypothetical protein
LKINTNIFINVKNKTRVYEKPNKYLPNIPSEAEVMKEGSFELGEMNKILLAKIEELTLYILQQEERIKALEAANKQ